MANLVRQYFNYRVGPEYTIIMMTKNDTMGHLFKGEKYVCKAKRNPIHKDIDAYSLVLPLPIDDHIMCITIPKRNTYGISCIIDNKSIEKPINWDSYMKEIQKLGADNNG